MTETEPEPVPPTPKPLSEPLTEPESDTEPEDDPEPVEEPEEPEEPGDEQLRQAANDAKAQNAVEIERKNRALENEARRHANRVVEIMGDDSDALLQCPLCLPFIPGFRWPPPPTGDQLAAVKEAIGEPVDPPLRPDIYSRICDTCDGYGYVTTGSKIPGKGKIQCKTCAGDGWVNVGPERADKALTVTGGVNPPVVYALPDVPVNDPPEVAALKALGYIVVPPMNTADQVA